MKYHKSGQGLTVVRDASDGPCRLVRFTSLPGRLVCSFDKAKNMLLIDQIRYDRLDERQQRHVFRSKETIEQVCRIT